MLHAWDLGHVSFFVVTQAEEMQEVSEESQMVSCMCEREKEEDVVMTKAKVHDAMQVRRVMDEMMRRAWAGKECT